MKIELLIYEIVIWELILVFLLIDWNFCFFDLDVMFVLFLGCLVLNLGVFYFCF